ncbi:MAG: hypothetical protein Q8K99_11310 [Actinomycetota bacterium]|nr:hypothetical protein [Actinomycetota bacterium]
MKEHDVLARTLAILGTVLVVLPLIAPFALGLIVMGRPGGFRLDYLMPFEVYPVTIVGMALLVWASFRARARKGAVGIAIAVMLGGLVLAGVAAQVTGIANSEEQLETWRYALTIALGAVSLLGQVALIVEGSLLTRDLFRARGDAATPLTPATG